MKEEKAREDDRFLISSEGSEVVGRGNESCDFAVGKVGERGAWGSRSGGWTEEMEGRGWAMVVHDGEADRVVVLVVVGGGMVMLEFGVGERQGRLEVDDELVGRGEGGFRVGAAEVVL